MGVIVTYPKICLFHFIDVYLNVGCVYNCLDDRVS